MASSESMKCLFKQQTFKQFKLAQLKKVLYKWFMTLREERRLRVFENRVLRRVFGPKRDEMTGK
jgi:hypothetical protein